MASFRFKTPAPFCVFRNALGREAVVDQTRLFAVVCIRLLSILLL